MSYVVHNEGHFLRKQGTAGTWAVTADVEKATPCDTAEEAAEMARLCRAEAAGTAAAKLAQAARVEHSDEFKPFVPSL
jgi:hypothetical protein